MADTSGAVLRQRLAEAVGDYRSLTTSGDGNADGTTVVDTELADLTEGADSIQGWVLMLGGSASGQVRRIKATGGYTATTLTVNFKFTSKICSGKPYELYQRFNPADMRLALNRAIRDLYPHLYLAIVDESLVIDDLLSNSGFETAVSGSTISSWTNVGTPNLVSETSIVRHGATSLKIAPTGAVGGVEQDVAAVNIQEVTAKSALAKFWVYATVADTARIRFDWGGSSFENSTYHSGKDQWELIDLPANVPTTATQLKIRLEVIEDGTAYFDAGYARIGSLYRYTLPSTIRGIPNFVEEQLGESDPVGNYGPIGLGGPTPGRRLRLRGTAPLSQPSTDTATTEVGEDHVELIVAKAAQHLYWMAASQAVESERDRLLGESSYWADQVRDMLPHQRMAPMSAMIPRRYHFEQDSSGRYLTFDSRN